MIGIDVDLSDLSDLADDWAGVDVMAEVRPAVTKGAVNVKKQLRDEMKQSSSFGKIAGKISFEQKVGKNSVEAVIGPRADGVGKLENIAYFGGSRGGGGSVPDPSGALEAEAPKFEEAIMDAVAGVLDG